MYRPYVPNPLREADSLTMAAYTRRVTRKFWERLPMLVYALLRCELFGINWSVRPPPIYGIYCLLSPLYGGGGGGGGGSCVLRSTAAAAASVGRGAVRMKARRGASGNAWLTRHSLLALLVPFLIGTTSLAWSF